jgi:hypothetical protein
LPGTLHGVTQQQPSNALTHRKRLLLLLHKAGVLHLPQAHHLLLEINQGLVLC